MSSNQTLDIMQIMLDSSVVVKGDLLLLVGASVASWGIIFKKNSSFKKMNNGNEEFYTAFKRSYSMKELFEKCDSFEATPFRRLFEAGYTEFNKIRDVYDGDLQKLREHFVDFGVDSLNRALNSEQIKIEEELGDSLTMLASIGAISPFIGLFGTVWGIIDSFASLAQGGATLETVAPGIAEALVATAIGLVAAIPATWYYNKFGSKKTKMSDEMIYFREEFINEIERILAKRTHG